jgi:hypothetical protein
MTCQTIVALARTAPDVVGVPTTWCNWCGLRAWPHAASDVVNVPPQMLPLMCLICLTTWFTWCGRCAWPHAAPVVFDAWPQAAPGVGNVADQMLHPTWLVCLTTCYTWCGWCAWSHVVLYMERFRCLTALFTAPNVVDMPDKHAAPDVARLIRRTRTCTWCGWYAW